MTRRISSRTIAGSTRHIKKNAFNTRVHTQSNQDLVRLKYLNLLVGSLLVSCGLLTSADKPASLALIQSVEIDVREPSGLTLDAENDFLYCVSDPPDNQIYKLDIDGNVLEILDFEGEDLEGISFDSTDGSLWVVDEMKSEYIHVDLDGDVLSRARVNYNITDVKNGLEGICIRPDEQDVHIIKQKHEAAVIKIDMVELTQSSKTFELDVDITGICEGRGEDEFLILSAGQKKMYEWSWDEGILATYSFDVNQAEGVVYDPGSSHIYVVCDSESILYTFKFPE